MNSICKDIFRAIHEGKWLSIEYRNKENQITKYWIGIKDINVEHKSLRVDGLHLGQYEVTELACIYIDSIVMSHVIDGSYFLKNEKLIQDISFCPEKYRNIFNNVANLKILNYLSDCNKLDNVPYKTEYSLISKIDQDKVTGNGVTLSIQQFQEIISYFQNKAQNVSQKRILQLAINLISVYTKQGLYVLAYRKLNLDVKGRKLLPDEQITICREFTINGVRQSIRKFLDADDYELLNKFEENAELIKDKITAGNKRGKSVDDMPYLLAIGKDILIDLEYEYNSIANMYAEGKVTIPIQAFFGDLTHRSSRVKKYPVALLNHKVNLDQLLAIHNALNYPVAYIQGPPGTGKTNTIINTITSAFFAERTVLFCSHNNHPINSVFDELRSIEYKGMKIPFPIVRLGNNEKVLEAITYIREIYEKVQKINIFETTLERKKGDKIEQTKKLTELLKKYEEILELKEKKATINRLLESSKNSSMLQFQTQLQGQQLAEVEAEIKRLGEVKQEEALSLIQEEDGEFRKYLYYKSAQYWKKLGTKKYDRLKQIIYMQKAEEKIEQFNKYLSDPSNLLDFLDLFPIVATTCISAHKLGKPKPYFDMVVMDEASQCNTAISLVPIIRGKSLMLVGDPQQLNPVIVLDPKDNMILRKNYKISKEYDYIEKSIYQAYLACDAVSEEVLLSHHYRCHKKIIEFNNHKYYNNKLTIETSSNEKMPLVYVDIEDNQTNYKNTAPLEAEKIIQFAELNKDKSIGVITPFVNQKEYIVSLLDEKEISNVSCGTVHAFQGDEKDIIIFSTAITNQTYKGSYDWLKNNKQLINVATSRAKEQLIVMSSSYNLQRFHEDGQPDDLYELIEYVRSNGTSEVTQRTSSSRALGIKPYSTETEEAFLTNLNHALDNVILNNRKCTIKKEVAISHVFHNNPSGVDLFYTGRFDFVVYEKRNKEEFPILAIELDGKEHIEDEAVRARDKKKNKICQEHGFELIRIENSYARRYNFVKDILISYFKSVRMI
jgi:hypothetical protein